MNRRGMTLVEMMVAVTATLILMGAVAQVFSVFGSAVSNSRAMLDLDSRMRVTANRLRTDLRGITARTLPPLDPDSSEGYFEIVEGPWTETTAPNAIDDGDQVASTDVDDALLFTTRSLSTPFVGRSPNGANATFESSIAEVAWFARESVNPNASGPKTYTLYRKQMLVMGYVNVEPFQENNSRVFDSWKNYYLTTDVSARNDGGSLRPNTLADLTKPENRFMHKPGYQVTGSGTNAFPYLFVPHMWPSTSSDSDVAGVADKGAQLGGLFFDGTSSRAGEDVMLTNVLSFDVRVFDPGAPVSLAPNGTPLVPRDPGPGTGPIASGGYVDLGYGTTVGTTNPLLPAGITPHFSAASGGSLSAGTGTRFIYDTWSTHYESDGIDQDVPADGADEGSNGIDDDGNGQVDELGEQEGVAPYAYPLRGMEVRIRCYEPSSRQVRQITVRHTFVPH